MDFRLCSWEAAHWRCNLHRTARYLVRTGGVTKSTESYKNRAATLIVSYEFLWIPYVEHVMRLSSRLLTIASCFGSRLRVRVSVRFRVWLVSCYAHVFVVCTTFDCHCHTVVRADGHHWERLLQHAC